MKKVYITGARGMLGQEVAQVFSGEYEIFPPDLEEVDITDAEKIINDIYKYKPDLVVHLAAMTDVDGCEKEPDTAYRVNSLGTRNVALACQRCNCELAYISTGSVYRGDKCEPYTEFDTPDPRGVYAISKYQGELYVRELLNRFYIIYTCWLFGGGKNDKKFVAKIIELAKTRNELRVVNDRFGSPTYTVDLAKGIKEIVATGLYGKYHCVNEGKASRFDVAKEIVRIAGIDNCKLVPVSSAEFPLPAPRPINESMQNYQMKLLGLKPMRRWQDALEEYISNTFR